MSRQAILLCILAVVVGVPILFSTSSRPPSKASGNPQFPTGFSSWDGSNLDLVARTKAMMNDPGSFEHVETRWENEAGQIHAIMKYRGKNAFGGVVTNFQGAMISTATGKVVKMLD